MNPKINYLLFLTFIFVSFILVFSDPINSFYPQPTYDEVNYYQPAVKGMQEKGIIEHLKYYPDTKPLPFMIVEYILNGSILYTRILNWILVAITTIFIFKVTNSKLSFLYPLIVIFLGGNTFNPEAIKAMFLVMSFYYMQYNGILIGLATIFNPFSILYGMLLNKKNLMYFIIIGEIFAAILLITGLFFPYLYWLILYETLPQEAMNWIPLVFLGVFFVIGSKNKTILKYALLSAIPILTRPFFDHYYIVTYTVLFVGFLLQENQLKAKR